MFRWIFCQLEALHHCLPPSVRRTLGELPESLDETYERILMEIKKSQTGATLDVYWNASLWRSGLFVLRSLRRSSRLTSTTWKGSQI
ncbi:hypothetical protein DFH94DRAFT_786871 [Russula ochroleuca]|uniref:Uncharacterized protein n=1 Tax=Russula ochroleuca TaxID=152965 RepID=A0A9P5MPW1_9AGAM|nr:hypothetical protein DFH94DRAFT_786871 [Russula ochroleuca]